MRFALYAVIWENEEKIATLELMTDFKAERILFYFLQHDFSITKSFSKKPVGIDVRTFLF